MTEKVILLIEDNADDELLTVRALKKNGITNDIVIARDGQEALEYLFGEGRFAGRDCRNQPQVILLDLKLPKVDGIDVLKAIRHDKRTQYVPTVVLTSSKEDRDINACYGFGANSYVRKPVSFDEFLDTARQLGRYWLTLNETAHAK